MCYVVELFKVEDSNGSLQITTTWTRMEAGWLRVWCQDCL